MSFRVLSTGWLLCIVDLQLKERSASIFEEDLYAAPVDTVRNTDCTNQNSKGAQKIGGLWRIRTELADKGYERQSTSLQQQLS